MATEARLSVCPCLFREFAEALRTYERPPVALEEYSESCAACGAGVGDWAACPGVLLTKGGTTIDLLGGASCLTALVGPRGARGIAPVDGIPATRGWIEQRGKVGLGPLDRPIALLEFSDTAGGTPCLGLDYLALWLSGGMERARLDALLVASNQRSADYALIFSVLPTLSTARRDLQKSLGTRWRVYMLWCWRS